MSACSSLRFDWAATVLAAIFTGGVFLDGWAHTHGRVDDTFFTPWHAALYAGFLAMALLLVGRAAWGVARDGLSWRRPMPEGYGLALAGVACWVVGGPFDALWHEVFGFEADVEALMSPAHAVLALALTTGIAWSTHLWVGTVVFASAVGWLLSYLILPPRLA